jgi:hypothetical protein
MTNWVIVMTLFSNCGNGKRDIRNFYFPLTSLQQPLVYEYRSIGKDNLPPFYCYMNAIHKGDSVFFITNTYGADLETFN